MVISQPIIRNDNHGASVKVRNGRHYLNELKCERTSHNNKISGCVGKSKRQWKNGNEFQNIHSVSLAQIKGLNTT